MACNVSIDNPNATETAFLRLMDDCGFSCKDTRARLMPNEKSYNRILFTSFRKKSATILRKDGVDWLFTFGSVNYILKCCSKMMTKEGTDVELKQGVIEALQKDIISANDKSLRTLGIACKALKPGEGGDDHLELIGDEKYRIEESDLTFLGMVGLKDPLREGVRDAVKAMHEAGIIVRMVTGDTKATATAIAKDCGILPQDGGHFVVMEGVEFETRVGGLDYLCKSCEDKKNTPQGMVAINVEKPKESEKKEDEDETKTKEKDKGRRGKKKEEVRKCSVCQEELQATAKNLDEFKKLVDKLMVIAACRPSDKYLLVSALKFLYQRSVCVTLNRGNVVAVTGDGSNDAPALKKADIGLAMGEGTDLAKDAAGIVLLDNNFASIRTAVKWGRNIFDSIRKFIQFQVAVNITALVLAFVGSCIISQSPLTAIQLLWINLIMDSLASLSLATDNPTPDQLKRPPTQKDEYIITKVCVKYVTEIGNDEEHPGTVHIHDRGAHDYSHGRRILYTRGLLHRQ